VFALPVAVVVLRWTYVRRAWGTLGRAAALAAVIIGVLPLWNARTTGDWRIMPYTLYAREYAPADAVGFGFDSTPPRRALPPDMERMATIFEGIHRGHTVAALPAILWRRIRTVANGQWRKGRVVLLPLALLGALALPAEGLFALATGGLLLLGYLAFGYDSRWGVYYLEIQPVLAFAAAVGLWRALSRLPRGPAAPALALLAIAAPVWALDIVRDRTKKRARHEYHRSFRELVERIPEERAVVFVRYRPEHYVHSSLIRNEPDLERARVWVVYDRGADNVRLQRLAPERKPYLYDEAARALLPLSAAVVP